MSGIVVGFLFDTLDFESKKFATVGDDMQNLVNKKGSFRRRIITKKALVIVVSISRGKTTNSATTFNENHGVCISSNKNVSSDNNFSKNDATS